MRKYNIHILLMLLATFVYFFVHFQRTAIPGAVFDILQIDLNASATQVTALGSIFMYSYAIGTLFSGVLIDKFGGIKVFSFGAALFALSSLLFSNTSCLPFLYLSRSLVGFGAATIYLSIISEAKKCFPDRYFGIAIAIILFIGYLGGIFANAPFIFLSDKYGWHPVLNVISITVIVLTVSYIIIQRYLKHSFISKKSELSIKPFKEVLKNKQNIPIYAFYVLCTSLHYTIMTVIGVKFLNDFMRYPTQKSALILSFLVIIAAFSGIILSALCKMLNNNRVLFVKIIAHFSFVIFGIISLLIFFNVRTILIPIFILILSLNGGNTPISIPIIANINKAEIRSTALSIVNCFSFITVGLFATFIGFILDSFPVAENLNGCKIYSGEAYFVVFLIFTLCALIEIIASYKINE